MWTIQEPKNLAVWNKQHFEKKTGECAVCLKYSELIFVEKIYKTQHLEGSGTPVLYIGRTVHKGYTPVRPTIIADYDKDNANNEARDSKTNWSLNVCTACKLTSESFSETDHSHIPSLMLSASIKAHKKTEESKGVTHGTKRKIINVAICKVWFTISCVQP
jgi:hypothetical protein